MGKQSRAIAFAVLAMFGASSAGAAETGNYWCVCSGHNDQGRYVSKPFRIADADVCGFNRDDTAVADQFYDALQRQTGYETGGVLCAYRKGKSAIGGVFDYLRSEGFQPVAFTPN